MAKHTLNISESSTENIRRRDFFRTATSTYIFHGTFLELTEGLFKQLLNKSPTILNQNQIFFPSGFSFTDTDNSQDSRGRDGTILFHSITSIRSRTFRHFICNFAPKSIKTTDHFYCHFNVSPALDQHLAM